MVLTDNRQDFYKPLADVLSVPVKGTAGVHIYQGALVNYDATGYALPATDTAGEQFAGVSIDEVNQATLVADGTNSAKIWSKNNNFVFYFDTAFVASQANIGAAVYVVDDSTVNLVTANSIRVGVIEEIISASKVAVRVGK